MTEFDRFYQREREWSFVDRWVLRTWVWMLMSAIVLMADMLISDDIHFSILYIFAVAIVGWTYKRLLALWIGAVLAFVHIPIAIISIEHSDVFSLLITAVLRLIVFEIVVVFMSVLRELKILRGLLHVCSYCGRIREGDRWVTFQQFISDHSEAMLSHGICSDCMPRVQSEFEVIRKKDKNQTNDDQLS